MKVGLMSSYKSLMVKATSPTTADVIVTTAAKLQSATAAKTPARAELPTPQLRDILRSPLSEAKPKLVDTLAKNREDMIAAEKPGKMFEVRVNRGQLSREAMVKDLQRADKMVEQAFDLAWSGDPFDAAMAMELMEQASRIRTAVGKLLPEFQQRLRTASAWERSGFDQVLVGAAQKDPGAASSGLTDYRVAREQFVLIKDDILGRPHGGPSL